MIKERTLETIALLMIGDGLVAAAMPRRHVRLWEKGPRGWQRAMEPFVRRPGLTRWLGLAEAALGFWLARRQQPDELAGAPESPRLTPARRAPGERPGPPGRPPGPGRR